jgi:hypothetical protein
VLPRTATAGVCTVALAAALTACGGGSSDNGISSKTPEGIVSAASEAIKGATSVHVSGSTTSSGAQIKLDLNLVSGQGGEGQMSIGGASLQIVEIGPTVYVKAGSAFWNQFGNARAARLLSGRWLKAPASGKFSSFAELTDQTKLFDQLLSRHGTLSKGATSTVSGQKVIAVLDKSRGGTLYVATTGKPFPVALAKGGSGGGRITFDRIGQKVSLSAPSGAITLPASAT